MLNKITNLVAEEKGQGLTEYGLLLAMVVALVVAAVTTFGGSMGTLLGKVVTKLNGVTP